MEREQIIYMSEGQLFNILIREFLVLYIQYFYIFCMFLEDVVTVSHHGQVNVQPFAAAGGKTASSPQLQAMAGPTFEFDRFFFN